MSWTLIEHQALTSLVASVTLGSGGTIPQTYKTLKVVISARTDRADNSDGILVRPNNSSTNGSGRLVFGTGSTASSGIDSDIKAGSSTAANDTASTFGSSELTIPNYAGSTNKPMSSDAVNENNAATAYQVLRAGLWSNTAAITSLVFLPQVGTNFVSGSTFTLYGLA